MARTLTAPAASETVTATSAGATLTAPSGNVGAFIYVDNSAGANDVSLINPTETPAHSARRVEAGQRGGPFGPYDPAAVWPKLYAASSTAGVRVSYDQVVSE